ncbi:hypothetical protein EVG20_g8261 [Dentipellis fragilis]|uniref:Uncharacterized protein n=1 Tax=Dentipellis fragilis TaxID=205917 RepID=A0A4Y9Y8P4_9AGAM|nr:hypothetical protein EVG20_g8261 [Dentipellis fragilis]
MPATETFYQEISSNSQRRNAPAPWESAEWEGPSIDSVPIQRQRFPLHQDKGDERSGSARTDGGELLGSRSREATSSPHLDLNALSRNRSRNLCKASISFADSQMQPNALATSLESTRNMAPRYPRGSALATGYSRRRSSRSRVRFASPLAESRLRSPSPMSEYSPTIDVEPERLRVLSPPPDRPATPMRGIKANPERLSAPSPSPPAIYSDLPTPSSSGSPTPPTPSLDSISHGEITLRGNKHVMHWYASSGQPPSMVLHLGLGTRRGILIIDLSPARAYHVLHVDVSAVCMTAAEEIDGVF